MFMIFFPNHVEFIPANYSKLSSNSHTYAQTGNQTQADLSDQNVKQRIQANNQHFKCPKAHATPQLALKPAQQNLKR